MTCHTQIVDGQPVIVCSRMPKARSCIECPAPHTRLCDWKLRPDVTCSTPLCDEHTSEPAPGKDLCPRHVQAWAEHKANENRQGILL